MSDDQQPTPPTDVAALVVERDALVQENTRLRAALATSKDPCAYCQLPAEEMTMCRRGFPGCDRADDLIGCPEFGAMLELENVKAENARLREEMTWLSEPGNFRRIQVVGKEWDEEGRIVWVEFLVWNVEPRRSRVSFTDVFPTLSEAIAHLRAPMPRPEDQP